MYCGYPNATTETGPCSAGYYCREGADTPTPEIGATGDAGPCPMGRYCPKQTGEPKPCPIGTYSNMTHLNDSKYCELCGYGHYCGQAGRADYSGNCAAGFYCLRGSKVPNPPNVTASGGPCPVGHYCPEGTSFPLGCNEGTYNDKTGQSMCTPCCSGYHCPSNSTSCILECPKGFYCPNGTKTAKQYPCPKGTYNNYTGMQSIRYTLYVSIHLFTIRVNGWKRRDHDRISTRIKYSKIFFNIKSRQNCNKWDIW